MKKTLLIIIFTLLNIFSYGQTCTTLVVSDRIETYDWFGAWWTPALTAGYFTDISVSPNASAAIIGANFGNNTTQFNSYESDWYVLPNIVVNPLHEHLFKMRLAAQKLTNPLATTAGLDVGDYITVQLSTDGGNVYTNELRVTGRDNADWDYTSTAVASKIANGGLTVFEPLAGGNRNTTGDGYSFIELYIPQGVSNIAIDIFCRANRAGEEWWMDDFELYEIFDCSSLPIELFEFGGVNILNYNKLYWSTSSEQNNDYFTLERSINGVDWVVISKINGSGNSTSLISYEYKDYDYVKTNINYYRLSQTDYDGTKEYFKTIAIQPEHNENICEEYEYFNLTGSKIDFNQVPTGFYLRKCGSNTEKIFKP